MVNYEYESRIQELESKLDMANINCAAAIEDVTRLQSSLEATTVMTDKMERQRDETVLELEELQTTLDRRRTIQADKMDEHNLVSERPKHHCSLRMSLRSSLRCSLVEGLPSEVLEQIYEGLYPSHRFLAPVCQKFSRTYENHAKRKGQHCNTFKSGIVSSSQLDLLYKDGGIFFKAGLEHSGEDGNVVPFKGCTRAGH